MADDELRERALAAVEAELGRLRVLGRAGVDALADGSPHDAPGEDGLTLTTRVDPEDDRLMVLVEAWRGRRTFATGGFAMGPDGRTHTPE